MPRRKKNEQKPAAPAPFRNTPFTALKGVIAESPPVPTAQIRQAPVLKPEPATEDLFLQAMADVRRLEETTTGRRRSKPDNVKQRDHLTSLRQPPPRALPRDEVTGRKTFLQEVEKLQLDVRFEDSLPSEEELRPLAGNRLRQLKRGIIQLDRQLDLHGLTREEAIQSLAPFLAAARNAGEKAVLIITGKGVHSAEGPVLQQVVAGWLRDQGRDLVSEYAPAPREMGGSGAFVTFLRPLDK